MHSILKPTDLLTLSFLLLLSCLAVCFTPVNPSRSVLLATYALLVIAVLSAAVYRARGGTAKRGFHLSVFTAVVTVLSIFSSLGAIIASIHATTIDARLVAMDHSIFGVHPTVWMERLITPPLSTLLLFAYLSYYFIPLLLGSVLIAKGKFGEFEDTLFGILLCFYLSYACYLLFPAIGPRFTLSHLQAADLRFPPFIQSIQDALNSLEKNKTDAFPSGHTAISLTSLYYAWKEREKRLFVVFIPIVTGLIFSTVYLRYHYVIDVIAGIGLAGVTIALAPGLERLLSGVLSHPGDTERNPT